MVLSLNEILGSEYELTPYQFIPNAIRYETETPLHKFISVLAPLRDATIYLVITARDSFNEVLCNEMIQFVNARSELSLDREIEICDEFACDAYEFNSVLILNSTCHRSYATISEDLHAQTLAAFPIMRCEFTGAETPGEVDAIRHYGPCTIDWNRKASPYLQMRFSNQETGAGTRRKQWSYMRPQVAEQDILELTDVQGSFAELKNFLFQEARIVVEDGKFAIQVNGMRLSVARSDFGRWLGEYLSMGV